MAKLATLNGMFSEHALKCTHICIHIHKSTSIYSGEVESLRIRNGTLRDRKDIQRQELEESKERVTSLRAELKSVEATLQTEKVCIIHHHHYNYDDLFTIDVMIIVSYRVTTSVRTTHVEKF